MKGKPLFPFAAIAVVGLILMISLSFIGVYQKEERLALEGEDAVEEQPTQDTADTSDPIALGEQAYQATCIGCHGGSFDGPMGNLIGIGDRRSKEEIMTIIHEGGADYGLPGMPAFKDADAEAIAEYLIEVAN